jgi:hypothetical protein
VGRGCSCVSCGRGLASKGHYPVTFRPLYGDVPVRVRRLLTCPCQGQGGARSSAALDLGNDAVAPELAYITARYAALTPFGKVATLLSELLPMSGAQNAGTVRNRTLRVGETVVQRHGTETTKPTAPPPMPPVVVGLDGDYVRSRHRQEERHFEVIAGAAGVHADTPATLARSGSFRCARSSASARPRIFDGAADAAYPTETAIKLILDNHSAHISIAENGVRDDMVAKHGEEGAAAFNPHHKLPGQEVNRGSGRQWWASAYGREPCPVFQ